MNKRLRCDHYEGCGLDDCPHRVFHEEDERSCYKSFCFHVEYPVICVDISKVRREKLEQLDVVSNSKLE